MTEILEIAKDFAEDLAPHVISQTGTVKTLTAEQVSALYHIAVDFWMRNDEASVDVKLPFEVLKSLRDKCEIDDLHFHDSRHEACTRLAQKLEVLDLARMIGHKDLRSLMIYYNATASEIANRLD